MIRSMTWRSELPREDANQLCYEGARFYYTAPEKKTAGQSGGVTLPVARKSHYVMIWPERFIKRETS